MKISPEEYGLICTALSHSIVLLQQADVHGEYDTEFDCHSGKDLHEMAGQMRALLEELVGPNLELRRDAEERADDYHRDAVELITMIIGQKMKWPGSTLSGRPPATLALTRVTGLSATSWA